jgi:hypothetical protein
MSTLGGMKHQDVLQMKKACDEFCGDDPISRGAYFWGYMQGVSAERKACAKLADAEVYEFIEGEWTSCAIFLAKKIRARGEDDEA